MAYSAQRNDVLEFREPVDMSHILPGQGAQKDRSSWSSTLLQMLVLIVCCAGIFYEQKQREDVLLTRMGQLEKNANSLVSNKRIGSKLGQLLTAREVQLQQFWKDLGDQLQRSRQVRTDFQKEIKKDTEFQTHLTGILNSVSNGIKNLRQQAVPGENMPEENWEKDHFPEIWRTLRGLEASANHTVGNPMLMKKLRDEVSWLTEQLNYAKQDMASLERQDDFHKVQHQFEFDRRSPSAWSLAEANSSSTKTKDSETEAPARSSFLDKSAGKTPLQE